MSKRFDNKRLLYILAGLIVVMVLTFLIKIPKERATLKERIVELDSSDVSKIILYSKSSSGNPVEFIRNNGKWRVHQGKISSVSKQDEVENIIMEIMSIKPQNLVSKSKTKWAEFEVTDSTGTRIKFLNKKGNTVADLMVGRFSYKQLSNQNSMYGRNNIQGTSYVRISGEDEVYGVDGFLSLSFNRTFNDWRDNTLIRVTRDDITSLRFIFPADSSYTLTKKDSRWFIDSTPADSSAVASFLATLSNVDGQDFDDTFKADVNPDYQLVIEGNNLLNITVKSYRQSGDNYILNSSLNPDICFSSKADGAYKRIFKSKKEFI
jgi:hypothetical protein